MVRLSTLRSGTLVKHWEALHLDDSYNEALQVILGK